MNIIYKFKSGSYYEIPIEYIDNIICDIWSTYPAQKVLIQKCIRNRLIPEDNYVLCPLYYDPDTNNFLDFQFGATETYKKNESDISAFYRCLGEELGLYYNYQYEPYNENFRYAGKDWIMSIINIKDLKSITEPREKVDIPDNKRKKMATIVHGKKEDILKYIKNPLIFDKSEDELGGVVSLSFKDIKNTFPNLY